MQNLVHISIYFQIVFNAAKSEPSKVGSKAALVLTSTMPGLLTSTQTARWDINYETRLPGWE